MLVSSLSFITMLFVSFGVDRGGGEVRKRDRGRKKKTEDREILIERERA